MQKVDVSTKAILASLSIGVWQGSKTDRKVSRELTSQKNAERDSAKVTKFLIPKWAIEDINITSQRARTYFYQKTLPWKDSGERILPRQQFFDFAEGIGKIKKDFDQAVDRFVTEVYPRLQDETMIRLGDLYEADNFPSPEVVRRKFYLNLEFDPIADSRDFRVNISEEAAEQLRGQIEDQLARRLQETSKEVLRRLETVVDHFATKMKEGEIFKAATVENLQKVVSEMKVYNLAEDKEIDALATDLTDKVSKLSAETLRADPQERAKARQQADDILERIRKMQGVLG